MLTLVDNKLNKSIRMGLKKLPRFFLILLLVISPLFTMANFDFNANCLKAYQNIFELKLNTARQLIATEKRLRPENSIVPLLENYVDYFYLITTENKAEFERLERNKSDRLAQISKDDKSSPYYLYAQAEINLQWALIRSRYGSYYAASREINKANSFLKENQKKFPGFHLNQKGLGFINVVIGAMPDGFMKSTLATFGIKGDIETGLKQLNQLAENLPKSTYEPFYEEVIFYYVYLLSDVAKSESAYAKTMKYTSRMTDSSLLKTYLQAYVASRSGKNDHALKLLENKPEGGIYQNFAYLDYLLGVVKLNKLDFTATGNFELFLRRNKGDNYIKDAYMHLAWIALLKNDTNSYRNYLNATKTKGATFHDKDKQALNEANGPTPNITLLKARLLFDGGYLARAAELLNGSKPDDFTTAKDKTEYHYRMARIYDDLDRYDIALTHYQQAINEGKALKYYFAAKSAVFSGKIYEKKKSNAKAKLFYNMAIDMKNHEYESGIENDAKQGLKRIGG